MAVVCRVPAECCGSCFVDMFVTYFFVQIALVAPHSDGVGVRSFVWPLLKLMLTMLAMMNLPGSGILNFARTAFGLCTGALPVGTNVCFVVHVTLRIQT